MDEIRKLQENLDDHQVNNFFGVYYDDAFYWGKALHVSDNTCIHEYFVFRDLKLFPSKAHIFNDSHGI